MAEEEKKAEKKVQTPEEKRQSRADLLTLLLIVLVCVGIAYFSVELGLVILGLILWVGARATGAAV